MKEKVELAERMISEYILTVTGENVDVEITENQPVLVKEGMWHIYLIPRPCIIGCVMDEDIPFLQRIVEITPVILDIYNTQVGYETI